MRNTIDTSLFKKLLESGANNLNNQYQYVDSLNVFPVPDGDTGTNMYLTFNAGVDDCLGFQEKHLGNLAKTLSRGLLMGARGNSGVILSQIFRGFYQAIQDKSEITVSEFSEALITGALAAYKAVMRPVEGTMLTVVKEASNAAKNHLDANSHWDFVTYLTTLVEEAKISLENTPNLLPILKEVGVVDSGGMGLLIIFEGFLSAAKGEVITLKSEKSKTTSYVATNDEIQFGYCTEFIIQLNEKEQKTIKEETIKDILSKLGDSIVVVKDEDIIKVHVHTLKPGEVLNRCQKYGEFIKLKIENMQLQHENLIIDSDNDTPKKKYALIAVANGEGIIETFKELQVDYIITGGQTMNPATEDFMAEIEKTNAENIIILPNNHNIVLTANQAATAYENKNIEVIRTKTIPEGLSACINFDSSLELAENIKNMKAAKNSTITASVTYATKDTAINGLAIKANDYMGLYKKEIVVSSKNKITTAKELISRLLTEKASILTIIIGEDVNSKEKKEFISYLEKEVKIEYELIDGLQPVYSFIFGVE